MRLCERPSPCSTANRYRSLEISIGVLDRLDLELLSPDEREQETQAQIAAEIRGTFDLAHGPLFRTKLLRLGAEEHVLLLTMHHIVSDGWSIGVLMRELSALYNAFCTGKPSPLPELPLQYADYAVWQREWLQGRGAGAPARLLEGASRRRACAAGPAHRPSAAGCADLPRSTKPSSFPQIDAEAEGAGTAGRRHAVHDAAGGLSDAAVPLQRVRIRSWWALPSPTVRIRRWRV